MAISSRALLAGLFVVLAALVALLQCSPAENGDDGNEGNDDQTCEETGYSSGVERIGVMQSTDGGGKWTLLGHACFHRPDLLPVDPTPIEENGEIVLYFLDLNTLNGPSTQAKVIYRAESQDGLDFTEPTQAFSTTQWMITDPCVIRFIEDTGTRLRPTDGSTLCDPHPIRLQDGTYLVASARFAWRR